ncbi:kinase-like domain-containing protein [Russula compacta]|nr:kinase-like domain-containing protein [Russula compacta]
MHSKRRTSSLLPSIFVNLEEQFATRYFSSRMIVYYRTKEFSLNESVGRVEFARQLYNFLYMQAGHSEEEYKDTTEKIEQLRDEILEYRLHFATRSFNPKDIQESSGESARTRDSGSADPPDPGDCAELRAHGYEVKPEVIVDDSGGRWEPLFKRPSHILTVFRPSDPSKEFIAKKVRGDSKELEILKLLDAIQPKPEHIIPLLDSFHTQSSPWAILPEMSSVAYYLAIAPSQLSSKVAQVCWGLIKGLAYLHELCIAHRDIKPGNLLVDQDFCLKIIDFDLAMQVDDEDEKVDDQCGTEGWLAPEIKKSLMYSPIKADRWSCGCVLVYLLDGLKKEDKLLRTIGRELQAHNPEERPSLLDWHNWSAARSSDVVGLVKGGERKSLRSRDDGEGMEPPNAKKQRLSVGVGRE